MISELFFDRTCTAVFKSEAVLVVALVGQVSGQESARHGYEYGSKYRVPGHIEGVAHRNGTLRSEEVGDDYVIYIEENLTSEEAERNTDDE